MSDRDLALDLPGSSHELVLRNRYEVLSTLNDLLVAVWFLVGSILFFSESTVYAGTWLFVVGSAQLMLRPTIRLTRRVHLGRHRARHGRAGAGESDDDF